MTWENFGSTWEKNPRFTDCEADALTTTPLHRSLFLPVTMETFLSTASLYITNVVYNHYASVSQTMGRDLNVGRQGFMNGSLTRVETSVLWLSLILS